MENAKKSDAKAKISYRDSLDTITKARYVDKLKEIDGKDPYEMEKAEWSADMSEWPEVTYPDIVNYLVYTQSAYTLAELKAYKSLQGYKNFKSLSPSVERCVQPYTTHVFTIMLPVK